MTDATVLCQSQQVEALRQEVNNISMVHPVDFSIK